jgi:hypothetical protein
MDLEFGWDGGNKKSIQNFTRNLQENCRFGRPRSIMENNIKKDLRKVISEDRQWM